MRHVRLVESFLDMIRLRDDAPDEGVADLRGGAPVETPQEREAAEWGGRGVATGWPQGGQGVARGEKKVATGGKKVATDENMVATGGKRVARGWPWYGKGVPQTDLSPLWWAKATRKVRWKGDRPLRLFIWWGGVVVTLFLAGGPLLPVAAVPVCMVALGLEFFLLDPFEMFARRIAMQSRLLIIGAALFAAFAFASPSIGSIAVAILAAAIAALMVVTCNTDWVVTTNYISSPAIHSAMENDSTDSAHRSWQGLGSKLAYTYSSEMGYPPTSNFIWALLRGVYVIGWVLGAKHIVTEEEELAVEEDASASLAARAERLAAEVEALERENERLRGTIGELEGDADYLREQLEEAKEDVEKAKARANGVYWDFDKERKRNAELVGEHRKELAAMEEEHRNELSAMEERHGEELAEMERQLLEDSGNIRERFLRAELEAGITSASQLSDVTGIPRSTVRRILDRWKAEEAAGETGPEPAKEDVA